MSSVDCWLLFVVFVCLVCFVSYLLFVVLFVVGVCFVHCALRFDCCLSFVVRILPWSVFVVRWLSHVASCCLLCVVCGLLFAD